MVRAKCGSLNLLATGGRGGELTMGGDPGSFNQRVVGSIPTALTKHDQELKPGTKELYPPQSLLQVDRRWIKARPFDHEVTSTLVGRRNAD